METKYCSGCGQTKSIENFNWKSIEKGTRQSKCSVCTRKNSKSHYNNNKPYYINKNKRLRQDNLIWLLEYLQSHPCVDCGEKDAIVLEFDHISKKNFCVSKGAQYLYSKKHLISEIEKCEVVCANCHKRRTYKRCNSYRIL